jgi:hypothetical protein
MKSLNKAKIQSLENTFFNKFKNASPQAMDAILKATNAEMDEAIAQKRIPTLEGVHRRLYSSTMVLQ